MAKSSKLSSDSLGTKSRPSGKAMRHGNLGDALNAVDGALVEIESVIDTSRGVIVLAEVSGTPDTPAADKAVLYLEPKTGDVTKSQLTIKWQDGTTHVIAQE